MIHYQPILMARLLPNLEAVILVVGVQAAAGVMEIQMIQAAMEAIVVETAVVMAVDAAGDAAGVMKSG